jgi:hypothetical protein
MLVVPDMSHGTLARPSTTTRDEGDGRKMQIQADIHTSHTLNLKRWG